MYLYKQKQKNGDLYLAIKEKYHVPGAGSRERTVEKIGYLSELQEKYDDPVAYYPQYAKDLTRKKKEEEEKQTVSIDMTETLEIGTMDTCNVGYGILKFLYRDLELNKFWNWKTRRSRGDTTWTRSSGSLSSHVPSIRDQSTPRSAIKTPILKTSGILPWMMSTMRSMSLPNIRKRSRHGSLNIQKTMRTGPFHILF